MIQLNDIHRAGLERASLLQKQAPNLLSEFEENTLSTLSARVQTLGSAATCTPEEWRVVTDSLMALQGATS